MQHKKLTRKEKSELQKPLVESKHIQLKETQSQIKIKWILAIFIGITGFLLYANTLNHNFVLDDYSVIKENRLTRQGWDAFPQILKTPYRYGYYFTQDELYRPIPKAMFAIEWALSPDNAILGHWVNVIVYAFLGILLFFVLSKYVKENLFIPFAAALLFITHPIHTEVVANIKSRDEILSLFFLLAALYFIQKYLTTEKSKSLFIAMFFFLFSLLSKESGITFLAVFPLIIYSFLDTPVKKNLRVILFMFFTAAVFLLIRRSILDSTSLKTNFAIADNLLVAAPDIASRFATAIYILGIYLKLLFIPHPLVFDYSFKQIPILGLSDWKFILSFLIYAALLIYSIWRIKKKDGIGFSILYYLITLSIFSNLFITIGTSFGERLIFIPSLGFCLAIAFLLSKLFSAKNEIKIFTIRNFIRKHLTAIFILVAISLLYSFKTIMRNPVWKDNYTLFSNDVKLSPNSTRTHYYLGNLLAKPEAIGRTDSMVQQLTLDTAIAELKKAVEIYPAFADAYNQLGVSYYRKKNTEEAFKYYSKALDFNPTNASFHSNMGTLYFEKADYTNALSAFQKAITLDPNYTEGLANLGSTYGMLKDYNNALKYLQQCIKTAPDYTQAYFFLSITYQFLGDKQQQEFYMNKYKSLGGK